MVPGGIDFAKDTFLICVLSEDCPVKEFQNSRAGARECSEWLKSLGIKRAQLAVEPTGRYGELVCEYLVRQGHRILEVQPYMFRKYAQSLDMRGKSDHKDVLALTQYSKERGDSLGEWEPRSSLDWELRDSHLLIRSLTKRKVTLECQLQCGLRSKFAIEQLESELGECEKRLELIMGRTKELLLRHPVYAKDLELLLTIPGVAEKTAVLLLTLVDFRKFRTSRALACFLGLTKRKYESGTSVRGKEGISKRGSTPVRGGMFMPARSARIHNRAIAEFADRLKGKGKHDFCIQMAVIRKLVCTAWALVTKQVAFDHDYVNPNLAPDHSEVTLRRFRR